MAATTDLKVREKQEVTTSPEQTRPGLVFTPSVDIFESENEITLMADMPGVASDDITIDLNDGVLTITGEVKPWEESDESGLLIEFEVGKYIRQFTLSEVINQEKIEANLNDGVLRLVMPKAEKAMPRKISVNAG